MASPPESTPNSNTTTPPSKGSSNEQSSNSSPPSSSPSTSTSPPPKSPPPPPPQGSPPPHSPPPQSSPPPPKESPSSPPPPTQSQSPPLSSPPPQQHSTPASPPPQQHSTPASPPPTNTPTNSPPPQSTTPLIPPATTTPATPNPNSTSATTTTTPQGVFYPPPPVGALSPPSTATEKSPSPSSSSSSHSSGSKSVPLADTQSTINVAVIAGVTAASVLLIALVILIVACLLKKKKKPYYPGPPKGCDPYYGTPTQWHSPQGHIVQIAPPPGVMGTPVGGGGGWAAQPHVGGDGGWVAPPPPNFQNTSSEFSSSYTVPVPGHTPAMPAQSPNVGLGLSKSQFSYDELAAATGGFSQANLLGQGGFGYVHKGVLPNGQTVAVKSLKSGSGQGEREFQAEVEIISRVHHRHLVSLVGYCIADGQRMLVYEFVPNKTMEFHLHGKGQPVMDWDTRLRIALGSAKGLGYLHEDCHPKIIHRDIKAANILLDDKFEAMVADFGLAKLSADNNTHVSTRVMGTFGYLAPEYASSGKLTEKSDVFSFGVMLLELITSRKPVDPTSKFMEDSLVDWARPLLTKAIEEGNYKELVDPRLEENFATDEMARMVACAAACIRHSARRRPKMSQILRALDGGSLDDLNEGRKAGQGISSNGNTQVYDTGAYNADMMKFRQMVMSSQEFLSSEYEETTSEYAQSSSSGDSREAGIRSGAQRQKL